ncbi:unnamed protein product [Prunus brigantina]
MIWHFQKQGACRNALEVRHNLVKTDRRCDVLQMVAFVLWQIWKC